MNNADIVSATDKKKINTPVHSGYEDFQQLYTVYVLAVLRIRNIDKNWIQPIFFKAKNCHKKFKKWLLLVHEGSMLYEVL